MDSKEDPTRAEVHHHITVTDNSDTMALQRKRARRVSFAETTSIRLFIRDEESDQTPLIETAKIRDDSPGDFGFRRHPEPNMEFGGLGGGNDNDEDEEMDMRRTFLRPIRSPSPGGSTLGSASSNDEDNFFGPVSSNFIKPGRLSDSAASDEHHDVTMDSTALSMHYHSLARSESGLDLKTPTEGQLFFEEKTPMNATIGNSMTFTLGTKPIPISSTPDAEVSGNHNSNDMSLVGENPNKYDFEKLSPRLDALLAESRKDLLHVSVSDDIIASPSPKPKEAGILPSVDRGDNLINSSDYLRKETARIDSPDVLNEGESAAHVEIGEANDHCGTFASSPEKHSSNLLGAAESSRDNDIPINSPLSKVEQWELASPLPQPSSMLRNGYAEHQETETSIQKSISKLELLQRSAFSSAFSARSDNSLVKTLDFFKSPHHDSLLEKNRHISRIKILEDSVTEEKLTSVHQSEERSYASRIDHAMAETLNHISGENSLDKHLGRIVCGLPNELSAKSISRDQTKSGGTISSPSKITWSGSKLTRNLFTSKKSDDDALMTETGSISAEISSGNLTPKSFSDPNRRLGKKLSGSPGPQSTPNPKYKFVDNLPERDPRANSDGFVSHSAFTDQDEPRSQKTMVETPTTSPSRKEPDNEKSSRIPSPKTTPLGGGLERFSASKRNVELLLRDTPHRNEMILKQRSPKLLKGRNCDSETMLHRIGGGATLIIQEKKQWTDTYCKLSEDMKNLVSGTADRLCSKMICALEDVLVHQQRSKVYEMLHIGVMPQNSTADHDFQQKLAETKSLLHRVVFEKAKLQLKHVKKDRLLKRLQLLSSRIEESQKLGEDIASQPSQTATNSIVDAVCDRSLSVNLKKGHEAGLEKEKLTAMRHTLDTLDGKVLNLKRTFHTRCKIKSEPSSAETITLVNKHLAKRTSCRLIRQEMQMWVVHSVDSVNGQHNVILNYLDFIIQSITIVVGPAPSFSSSFKLNETNILKNFPNMDACIAFAFAFNAETAHRIVTSSLLGTLLDVVEEVQLTQMEFHNLTQSSFCSLSVERLDLVLCFLNFTSGRKVNVTLDMSCLKRGVYPSDVIPVRSDSESISSSEPIFDDIKEAVKGVETGYLRIMRLCKCVSQVV
ncbi:hypothetical protein CASFOL_022437 [Castilleja foliolosa]|uniref:Spc7 kinetochore protein domain-containing protein n=1 Tax=Castilleja foliolosa TaxID=1961234 RepID=A0ABD3CUJ0_9LAMI